MRVELLQILRQHQGHAAGTSHAAIKDESVAMESATPAFAAIRENWEPETTVRNLALIRTARSARGDAVAWATQIEEALDKRARG